MPYASPGFPQGFTRNLDDQGRPQPKDIRGGLSALGHDLRMAGVFGTRPAQPPAPGSPEQVSAFKGLFAPSAAPVQTPPDVQSYIDPNTGSQMATGFPGRYSQGDVLNLGRPPAVTGLGQASRPAATAARDRLPDELATHQYDFGSLV